MMPRTGNVRLPDLMTEEELKPALAAADAAHSRLQVAAPIADGLKMLIDPLRARKSSKTFATCGDIYHGALFGQNAPVDPLSRLELHQLMMVAGFYERIVDHERAQDAQRFVESHYNYDVRRDEVLVKAVQRAVSSSNSSDALPMSDVIEHLLILERKLFGRTRMLPVSGKQWLMLGVALDEVKTEKELLRILDIEPIRNNGNFSLTWDETFAEQWKRAYLTPAEEKQNMTSLFEHDEDSTKLVFTLRVLKPLPPLSWKEWLKLKALQYWVAWFALWCMFAMFDEEAVTMCILLYSKWQATRMMKAEARRRPNEKIYQAHAYHKLGPIPRDIQRHWF